ncbi:MAG: DUF1284 domain-containing protein [Lachnospiraceae bacterium]
MKEYQYIIRAHHGMCLAFFRGKGYSKEFTQHMKQLQSVLAQNPFVKIVCDADEICSVCPNKIGEKCISAKKVAEYDQQVLNRCGITEGQVMPYSAFERLVYDRILLSGKREEICGECQWNTLCRFCGQDTK